MSGRDEDFPTREAPAGSPAGPADAAPERHQRVKQLFMEALDVPPGRRAAFIAGACAGDNELRREVLELFLLHGEQYSVLDAPLDGRDALQEFANLDSGAVGPYRLERELGRGGMGVVHLAERDGRHVALKVLAAGAFSPELRERFRLEAAILERLDHPGLARVLEVGQAAGHAGVSQPWIAMEHIEGRPLLRYAREEGLSTEGRLRLMVAVCEAVQHAHAHGVVHRDLKPANILVRADGRPVVLDFGVARLVAGDERPTELATRTGQLVGTPQYMSPEQVQADPAAVGPPSDVYSLGVILYELLSGQVPYEASSVSLHRAIVSILTAEPRPIGQIMPAYKGPLERIAAMALEKEPRHRYPDAGALADDLRRHLDGRMVRARGPGLARRMRRWSRRRQRWVSVSALLLIGLAMLGAWLLGSERAIPRSRVLAAYHEAEMLVLAATAPLYEMERTPARLQEAIDLLSRARRLIGEVPPLRHRNMLMRRLEKDLGTAEFLLGEMKWDVGPARQAVVTLNDGLATPYDTLPSLLQDVQVSEVGQLRVPREEFLGLLAAAHLNVHRLRGEPGHLEGALYYARESLLENSKLLAESAGGPDAIQRYRDRLGYCYNALAEIGTDLAWFTGREPTARQALAWSDSAYAHQGGFALNWPALGSLLFERARAFHVVGAVTAEPAALDSAERYLAACSNYRGVERPRICAQTREEWARMGLARARLAPDPGERRRRVTASLADLDAAHRALASVDATPAQLGWLRSSQVEGFVAQARATGARAWLDSAAARLEETSQLFPPTTLPRHAGIQWLRHALLEHARFERSADVSALAAARRDVANAEALARAQGDSLVLSRVRRARADLGAGSPNPAR